MHADACRLDPDSSDGVSFPKDWPRRQRAPGAAATSARRPSSGAAGGRDCRERMGFEVRKQNQARPRSPRGRSRPEATAAACQ